MAQPDISSILAALAQNQANGTSQAPTPQQHPPPNHGPPPGYGQGGIPAQPPSAPPQGGGYLPQPSSTGSVDLSSIKPINSGSVSIADAIAKAKSIAADRGVSSYDPRQGSAANTPHDDPRLGGRDYQRSRSRSPQRRDSYSGNPYRDERREDSRRGRHRSPSPDRNFRGARDPPLGHRANDGETETIHVKSSLVGLIIGRAGENLRKVETDSGARVQFIQAKDSRVTERQCTISGSLRARENAKAAIYAIIDENGGQSNLMQEKGAYTAGMPGRAKVNLPALREGERSTQIMVPDKTVGLIIGRGGETIKDLQERSRCHVNIVGENKSINGLRPINLIGDDQATAMAKELILEIVESDNRGGSTGPGSSTTQTPAPRDNRGYQDYNQQQYGSGNSGGRDWIEKTIRVPSEAVGMIIGKGGETIKDTQKTTGCKINVNQPTPPDRERKIDLAGTARSMAEAERIIWDKVETVKQRDAAAGRGGGGGGGGRDSGMQYDGYSQPQQQPAVPGYGQYMPPGQQAPQAPPQMPPFQMPSSTHLQQQQPSDPNSNDPYAAWGGQQALYQWYAQQMANMGGQQPPPPGAAPGTQ